jgi:hypothetical protein
MWCRDIDEGANANHVQWQATLQRRHLRAITSTLSTRAAAPLPPASQTYELLARAVLRRRLLYDILPLSILPVWTSAICWKMWNSGGISASGILNTPVIPIHPGTLLMTPILWVYRDILDRRIPLKILMGSPINCVSLSLIRTYQLDTMDASPSRDGRLKQ